MGDCRGGRRGRWTMRFAEICDCKYCRTDAHPGLRLQICGFSLRPGSPLLLTQIPSARRWHPGVGLSAEHQRWSCHSCANHQQLGQLIGKLLWGVGLGGVTWQTTRSGWGTQGTLRCPRSHVSSTSWELFSLEVICILATVILSVPPHPLNGHWKVGNKEEDAWWTISVTVVLWIFPIVITKKDIHPMIDWPLYVSFQPSPIQLDCVEDRSINEDPLPKF